MEFSIQIQIIDTQGSFVQTKHCVKMLIFDNRSGERLRWMTVACGGTGHLKGLERKDLRSK